MSKYVTGSAKNFSEQTNVSLENPYTVIDLTALNKKMMPIGMFIALDYMWDKIKEDRTKNKRIFIDEIWHLMGANAPVTSAQFVQEIFKTIRGFGGGAVAATQELEDYFALNGGTYGKAILNACTLGMIMKTEHTSIKLVQEALSLEQREAETIIGFERGQALIVGGGNSVAVKVVASKMEHDLITTNADDLRRIAKAERLRMEQAAEGIQEPVKEPDPQEELTAGEILSAARRKQHTFNPVSKKKIKL
jgi:type IV secretory pathway VirB4 component